MTEICVQIKKSYESTIEHLQNLEYNKLCDFNTRDKYFTMLSYEDLQKADFKTLIESSIIVRSVTENGIEENTIINKTKQLDENQNIISESKTKILINNFEDAVVIFKNTNHTLWCDYEINSSVFVKNGIELILQNIKGLGLFIEIEETSEMVNFNNNKKFEELKKIANSLNLPLEDDYSCKKQFMYFKNHQV